MEETTFLCARSEENAAFQRKDYSKAAEKYAKCYQHVEEFGGAEKYLVFYADFAKSLIEISDTLAVKKQFLKAYEANPANPVVLTNLGTIVF